jgi:hypothetical protein
MHPVIHFQSRIFDLRSEPENPINPIHGSSLLDWLRPRIPNMSDPSPEDWGWYSHLTLEGRSYLIGSCAHESPDGNHEWVLQIDKSRSLKEKLFGQAKMATTDPCFVLICGLIQQESGFTSISVESGP